MKPTSISRLSLILLSLILLPQAQAIQPGNQSGLEGQQSRSLDSHPRSVLKTARGLSEPESEPDPGLSMSSLTFSDDETEEEEKENQKPPVVNSTPSSFSAEAHKKGMEALRFLKYQGIEGADEAFAEFHNLLADIQTMADPYPTLQRLVELSKGIGTMADLDEFLEKREAIQKIWTQVYAKLQDAMVALETYGRAAAESNNMDLRALYEKDSQSLHDIMEYMERRYKPKFLEVVVPEPSVIFRKQFSQKEIKEFNEEARENFYDEFLSLESLLSALQIDLQDLEDWKREIFWEADLGMFDKKIDKFLREKNRFMTQVESLRGRLHQVRVSLKNYWAVSRLDEVWKDIFEDAADKFQKLEEQVPEVEKAIPENRFELDAKGLSFAAINRTDPDKLPEILAKIAKLNAGYGHYYKEHANVKLLHQIYDQLHRRKAMLTDFNVLYKKADRLEKAFERAWHAEPGSLKPLLIAREAFDRSWGPTEDDLELIGVEVEDLRIAAAKASSNAWEKIASEEEHILSAYEALADQTSEWTLSALTRHYDKQYPSQHRNAYRELVKRAHTKIFSSMDTLDKVLELDELSQEGNVSQMEYEGTSEALNRQIREAQEAVKLLHFSPQLSVYQTAQKDDREREVFLADMEDRKAVNEQLSYLIKSSAAIFFPEEQI